MTLVTDCLSSLSVEDMAKKAKALGYDSIELATGNWSSAPHIDLDGLINSTAKRERFLELLRVNNLKVEVLNCSGNQLAPNEDGQRHKEVVDKTFKLAELLEIKTVVMMSGLPGGGPEDKTANWITTSWPPVNLEILDWQWNEVAIPYWKKTIKKAKEHGIDRIALENHGSQLVYNTETFFKLRNSVGSMIGINLDPSHLLWMGGDPISAVRSLGDAIYHVHAKDTRIEKDIANIHGYLDTKSIELFATRSWNYVALGHGQGVQWWKEFFSVLKMVGYEGSVSLEMEDLTMDTIVALEKSTDVLKASLPISFT